MASDTTIFIQALRSAIVLPANVQLSPLRCGTLVSVFDEAESEIISESIYSGMDRDPERAVLKAMVEFVERRAFLEGRQGKVAECDTERSDGFAAYPVQKTVDAPKAARENALCEAVERYVWAKWWDDRDVAHTIREVSLENLNFGEVALSDLENAMAVSSVVEIRPSFDDTDRVVLIYFAFLSGGGVVSGGACGSHADIENVRYRATGELLRHGLAVRKMKLEKLAPETFYERRLAHFGCDSKGADALARRLFHNGRKTLHLPRLKFDCEIPHGLSDLVAVHRCLFEDQPDFIGGELERFCI